MAKFVVQNVLTMGLTFRGITAMLRASIAFRCSAIWPDFEAYTNGVT